MGFRNIILPAGYRLRLHLPTARRGCEHFCFVGATVDFFGAAAHVDGPAVALVGKAAFVFGAIGVYLLHAEEHVSRLG